MPSASPLIACFCGQVFIVQLNVFACERPVHEVYDLKGSSYKRAASEREKQAAFVVLKDIDFKSDPNRAIKLTPVRLLTLCAGLTHSLKSRLFTLCSFATGLATLSLTLCSSRLAHVLTMSCAGWFRERRSPSRRS